MTTTASTNACPDCEQEFAVAFADASSLFNTLTRFCPRCGAKI